MSLVALLLVALGLSMDAFGASVGRGASAGIDARLAEMVRSSAIFGLFATLAPILGWAIGRAFYSIVRDYDHWIALTLLSVIGAKMIWDGRDGSTARNVVSGYRAAVVVVAAVATSIDALAVGLTLPIFHVNIWVAAALIGAVTFAAALVGSQVGRLVGAMASKRAEMVGGALLIVIGVKIVVEHTLYGPVD